MVSNGFIGFSRLPLLVKPNSSVFSQFFQGLGGGRIARGQSGYVGLEESVGLSMCRTYMVNTYSEVIEWTSARVPPTPIFRTLQIFSICHLFWSPTRPPRQKGLLEGFGGFEAWQTTGLNASNKLLMSPWRPRKSCWCGLGALVCGVRGAKRAIGRFWRAPVKRYWCRLEGQEKAVHVALVPWPAGSGVPKEPWEGFGGRQ